MQLHYYLARSLFRVNQCFKSVHCSSVKGLQEEERMSEFTS